MFFRSEIIISFQAVHSIRDPEKQPKVLDNWIESVRYRDCIMSILVVTGSRKRAQFAQIRITISYSQKSNLSSGP